MLVISRKNGQSLRIGDDIEVHIVSTRGNEVRLAFVAPQHTPIHREEIYRRIYGLIAGESQEPKKKTRRSRRRRTRRLEKAEAT